MRLAWLVVTSLLVCGCASPVVATSKPATAASTTVAQEGGTDGGPCDMAMSWAALVASGSVGEPTPHAALSAFLEVVADDVAFFPPSTNPLLVQDTATRAKFEWRDDDGSAIASVNLFNEGSGWIVNGGSSCA